MLCLGDQSQHLNRALTRYRQPQFNKHGSSKADGPKVSRSQDGTIKCPGSYVTACRSSHPVNLRDDIHPAAPCGVVLLYNPFVLHYVKLLTINLSLTQSFAIHHTR